MGTKQFDLKKYKLLTVVTVVILGCIIFMQGFWLYASYQREKDLFRENIDRSLATAISNIHLQKLLTHAGPELSKLLQNSTKGSISRESKKGTHKSVQNGIIITIDSAYSDTSSTQLDEQLNQLTQSVKGLKDDTTLTQRLSMQQLKLYKQAYKQELASYGIHVPFEIAVLDSNNRYIYTSIDTATFKALTIKTSGGNQNAVNLKGEYLVAAFPSSTLYILKRIALLLIVSVVLISLGCVSFSYLISLFFRQKKLSELRDHFMNNMTHELKTPVSSVSVALEMLMDDRNRYGEDKKRELLQVARKELTRLNTLIDSVLEIAATDKTSMELKVERVDLLSWLEEFHHDLSPLLSKTGASLSVEVFPPNLTAVFDRTHMTTIIQNLVENALKYSAASRAAVISVDVERENGFVVIHVKDNGIGIPSQYIDKVFDKFFRVPNGDRHDVKGYGLGLSYVKSLVEQHGGFAEVRSVLHEGSVFSIYLPVS